MNNKRTYICMVYSFLIWFCFVFVLHAIQAMLMFLMFFDDADDG